MAKRKKKIKSSFFRILIIFLIIIGLVFVKWYSKNNNSYIPFINEHIVIEIGFDKDLLLDNYYLAVNESTKLYSNFDDLTFSFSKDGIVKIEDNKVIGLKPGYVVIYASYKKNKSIPLKVTVTDLYNKASLDKKSKLKCNTYSIEDNMLLDNVLVFKTNIAGFQTRAGVVAAARFLTLEFPYTIEYFYENGRMAYPVSGKRKVDGEGRYYNKGLYLTKKEIEYKDYGPAPWGCKIYERTRKREMPNGLDCSGFVSWAIKQAGFDPGDAGAGVHKKIDSDLDDLGKKVDLNKENKTKFKVGDLIGFNGHIGMIIGIDKDTFYIAESYTDNNKNSLHVDKYSFSELLKTKFKYVMLMDSYYKEDGNLTNMWYN